MGVRRVDIASRIGIGRAASIASLQPEIRSGVVASRFGWRGRGDAADVTVHPQRFRPAIAAEQPIPERNRSREIAVPVAVVDEIGVLLSSPDWLKTEKSTNAMMPAT